MPVPSAVSSPHATVPVPIAPGTAIVLMALLLSIQPVTTDVYLPALPALTQSMGAGMVQAQLTLTGLLLAFGVSQLIWGPLSDRFGRRPILLVGLSVYTLAALASTFSSSMEQLIGWRIAQGAAMGAVVMCARAIVRDLYTPLEGARAMSKALTGLGLVACACVPIGGALSDLFSWRAALMALVVYAAGTLAFVALRMPETLVHRNPQALQPRVLWSTWLHVLRNPTFLTFSLLTMATYGGLFTFLASSAFVFMEVLGLNRTQYGIVMALSSFSYFGGTFLCRWLLGRVGLRRSVAIGGGMSLAGGGLMVLFASVGWQTPATVLVPFLIFTMAHGIHQPCGQSGCVGPFPRSAGVASALNGFMMMLVSFSIGAWLGQRMDGTVWPLVNGIGLWSVVLALISWTLVQKFGVPRERE